MLSVDVIVDLQAGDCGKGKVANWLAPNYDAVMRYNGGGNAGHTIYVNGQKIVTHQVPCGVLHNKVSIIGPECVVDEEALMSEMLTLESQGFDSVWDLLYVDFRAHVIQSQHLEVDGKDTKIGTTRKGIGPAYADKANRTGKRIIDLGHTAFRVCDVYDMFYVNPKSYFGDYFSDMIRPRILCEGAQGHQLDINFGRYPFVTSSHCVAGAACLNGIAPRNIKKVYGVMKAYRTYVGNDESWGMSNDEALRDIQKVGNEIGATTGRVRKTDWLDLDEIIPACKISGVDTIIINKLDVLETVGKFGVYAKGLNYFSHSKNFMDFVNSYLKENHDADIIWSRSPTTV